MSITSNLDGHDKTYNFERAYTGPGIYVLFDGRVCDSNIVYVGKSTTDVMMRVSAHSRDKDFDGVGVILPAFRNPDFIHDLEALVVAEYFELYGELPPYNMVQPRLLERRRRVSDWTTVARRTTDLLFA